MSKQSNATGWVDSKEMKEIRDLAFPRDFIPADFFEGPVDFQALKEQIRDLRYDQDRLNELHKEISQVKKLMGSILR